MPDDPDVFARHPRPWRLHPDYPRPGHDCDSDGVVIDANGKPVMWSSEWFGAGPGVLEAMLGAVNSETQQERSDGLKNQAS